jgi:hypothetical protein
MQLTVIPADSVICQDGTCYGRLSWEGTPLNIHAVQWKDSKGWIEFKDGSPNEDIDSLPDWVSNAIAVWQQAYDEEHKEPLPPTAKENKGQASILLQDTDWAAAPDISNPLLSNPYLVNQEEFLTYRNAIRKIAIYPTEGYLTWQEEPKAIWQTS